MVFKMVVSLCNVFIDRGRLRCFLLGLKLALKSCVIIILNKNIIILIITINKDTSFINDSNVSFVQPRVGSRDVLDR